MFSDPHTNEETSMSLNDLIAQRDELARQQAELSKAIAEAHGGNVSVDSEPSKGSTFILTLSEEEGHSCPSSSQVIPSLPSA